MKRKLATAAVQMDSLYAMALQGCPKVYGSCRDREMVVAAYLNVMRGALETYRRTCAREQRVALRRASRVVTQ